MKSEKMYDKTPKIEKDDKGKPSIKRPESKETESKPSESKDPVDVHEQERIDMAKRHVDELKDMHKRHGEDFEKMHSRHAMARNAGTDAAGESVMNSEGAV